MDSQSSSDSYTDLPRCPLCYERHPEEEKRTRILHETASARQHTACTDCVKGLLKGGNQLSCPFCRVVVDVKVAEKLPVFLGDDIELTMDETTHLKQVVEAVIKPVCSKCDDEATSRCEDCRIYLCEDCKREHSKNKVTKKHVVKELALLSDSEKANFEEVVLCEEHGLPVDMYCRQCEVACCLKCEEHLQHGYMKLKEVLEEKETIIKKEGTEALERKNNIIKDVRILKGRKEAVVKSRRQSCLDIKATVSTITRALKGQEEKLVEQVTKGNDKLISWLDQEVKTRENIIDVMRVVEDYFDQKRTIGETRKLELYKNIEQGLDRLHIISPDVEPGAENEGYYFLANSNRVHNLEKMDIGRIYSPSVVYDDDQSSARGSTTDVRDPEIRVLAIGKKRSGRSQTLIALMSQDIHINGQIIKGPGYGQWMKPFKGRTFLLSKTPGLDAAGGRDLDMERSDVDKVTNPGPHVLLLIIKNPDEDVRVLQTYMDVFQDDLINFLIIVFTGKRDLEKRRVTINTYVHNRGGELGRVLGAVNHRYVVVNTDDRESLPAFREALFKMIRELVFTNELRYLTIK